MKIKSVFLGIFCFSALVSCKIDKRYKLTPLPAQYAEKKGTGKVLITLKATVPEDDTFQLFYATDGTENYSQELSIFTQIKGSDAAQDIVFQLPDEALPTSFRLDLGENKHQDDMTIEQLTVNYYGKNLTIKGNDFIGYFRSNENLKATTKKNVLQPVIIDDNYDPIAFSEGKFNTELKAILVK